MGAAVKDHMTKPSPKLPPGSLCTKTLELLKNRGDANKLLDIHLETGIGFWWLRAFLDGRIQNPSVNNVQCLYEYLTKSKLGV
jgi:hypothetical protein